MLGGINESTFKSLSGTSRLVFIRVIFERPLHVCGWESMIRCLFWLAVASTLGQVFRRHARM